MNSLWGKFGQRNQLTQHVAFKNAGDFYALALNKKVHISCIIPVGNNMMRVTYEDKKPYVKEHKASNVTVALWTTRYFIYFRYFPFLLCSSFSAARLKLYEFMKMVYAVDGCEIL